MAGIIAALLTGIYVSRRQLQPSRWESLIDPALQSVLIERTTPRYSRVLGVCIAFALSLACAALAGPTWQRLPQQLQQRADALVIVLDLSLSMYTQDVPPSRLVRARHAITDVLRSRREGFTGLVAYAGDAHAVAPLTDDVGTIENLLAALAPDMMPILGSNTALAIGIARELFVNAGMHQGRILLVTDAIDDAAAITEFASRDFPISILGIGTAEGAGIPLDFLDQAGRLLTDRGGNTIVARLDEPRLADVARNCFGKYATATPTQDDVTALLNVPLPKPDEERDVDRQFDLWADVGYWLLVPLLPLALLNFRRGAVTLLLCALLPPPAHAGWWDDLWRRSDQQGVLALRDGEPDRAAVLFADPQWQGVARYRAGDYGGADQRFAANPSAAGHYNRGNALARQGRLEEAIAAYDDALGLTPDDADAKFNKQLLEQLLEEQQQASGDDDQASQDNQSESQSDASRSQQSEANPDSQSQDNDQGDPAQQRPTGEDQPADKAQPQPGEDESEQTLAEREEPRDEARDALEQWMRRVPDDPAGLLRRKFLFETNQRRRAGEGPSRDEERIW